MNIAPQASLFEKRARWVSDSHVISRVCKNERSNKSLQARTIALVVLNLSQKDIWEVSPPLN